MGSSKKQEEHTLPKIIFGLGDKKSSKIFRKSIHTIIAWRLRNRIPSIYDIERIISVAERHGYSLSLGGILNADPVQRKRGAGAR